MERQWSRANFRRLVDERFGIDRHALAKLRAKFAAPKPNYSTFFRWYNGDEDGVIVVPRGAAVAKLADALGVDEGALFEGGEIRPETLSSEAARLLSYMSPELQETAIKTLRAMAPTTPKYLPGEPLPLAEHASSGSEALDAPPPSAHQSTRRRGPKPKHS